MNGIVGTVGDAGRRDFFYLDNGFRMKQRTWNGREWVIDWIELGGIFTTVPAAVSTMGQRRPVVAPEGGGLGRGTGTGSGGATETGRRVPRGRLGEAGLLEQRIDVFGLGLDYAMYHKTLWGAARA